MMNSECIHIYTYIYVYFMLNKALGMIILVHSLSFIRISKIQLPYAGMYVSNLGHFDQREFNAIIGCRSI